MIKLLFVDVETTGFDPTKNSIIQIACIADFGGVIKERFNQKIRPWEDDKIDPEALKVNGLTKGELKYYPPQNEIFKSLIEYLDTFVDKYDDGDKFFFVGYNAVFDYQFLRNTFIRNGNNYFGSYFWTPYIDVMVLVGHRLMSRRKEFKSMGLISVLEFLNLSDINPKYHEAMFDARMTRTLYYELKNI